MSDTRTPPAVPADLATADGFSIATPGDWFVLPLDPRTRNRQIARLVERQVGKQDELAHVRRQIVVRLRRSAAEIVNAGGFFATMHGRVAGDAPMSASAIVSLFPLTRDRDGNILADVETIERALAASVDQGETAEHSVVDLPIGRAARVRRRTGSGIHALDGQEVPTENVQYYLPMTEAGKTLALAFSTPIVPLADGYARLFDAMAGTARWTRSARPEGEKTDR